MFYEGSCGPIIIAIHDTLETIFSSRKALHPGMNIEFVNEVPGNLYLLSYGRDFKFGSGLISPKFPDHPGM